MTYQESLLLTGDAWLKLSDDKKIEVLQTIENHMAGFFIRVRMG